MINKVSSIIFYPLSDNMSFSSSDYIQIKDWTDVNKFDIRKIYVNHTWRKMLDELFADNDMVEHIENEINETLSQLDDKTMLYPKYSCIFKAFEMFSFQNTKVVFIGQDPYFNSMSVNNCRVPQAYGLSFSVPSDFPIPSSLVNIYKNMLKFGHLKKMPSHGCLDSWAFQGCLMLNTSLTVIDGSNNKNCHSHVWKKFTDNVIKYISDNIDFVVFVIWGNEAVKKLQLIDLDKHYATISSHPSGLSSNKKMGSYDAFMDVDHFGKINKQLVEHNKSPIIFNI